MKTLSTHLCAAMVAALVMSATSQGGYNITQQSSPAPTYSNTLTFDEPGTPTGVVPEDTWLGSHGMTMTDGVNPNAVAVGDLSGFYPWINSGNAVEGNFGIYMSFENDVTEMSFQAWDPSGPPDLFGAGLTIVLSDENDNVLSFAQFTGAWGGIGDTWIDITTTDGDSFAKVSVYNNSFSPQTYMDNLSFNTVPAPGALALLGLAGMRGRRRRRS